MVVIVGESEAELTGSSISSFCREKGRTQMGVLVERETQCGEKVSELEREHLS